ncbi:hypothetical protein JCM24511_00780 [Saitozyma sp. JCM 24511]|nr:hypothetical protein JCM24511_00780 [Saitozyma sp. JCM 24511]
MPSDEPSAAAIDESRNLLPVPFLDVRWMHAGAQHLDLLPDPVTTASTSYKAFSVDESERIDAKWQSMSVESRAEAIREWGQGEGEGSMKNGEKPMAADAVHPVDAEVEKDEKYDTMRSGQEQKNVKKDPEFRYKALIAKAQKDQDLEVVNGVPVSQDSLFEVHLPTLSLHPVFWAHTGPRIPVLRGTWFVTDESRPCSWDLSGEIERAYQYVAAAPPTADTSEIRPWQPSFKHELATAISQGPAAEEKLRYSLPARLGPGLCIIFEDGEKGRLETSGPLTYISKAFWSSMRAKPSGTYVYRGYTAARATMGKSTPRSRSSSRNGVRPGKVEAVVEDARDIVDTSALEEETVPVVDDADDTPCTDLILLVHGIGQQLATQHEAYNFVYAGNKLRQAMRKQCSNPALAAIVRDRRIQLLPVQWRASLQLDQAKTKEEREHGMDNRYTVADITINKSIPYIRELTNSVLLDIPLFMSQHRQKMIEAVCIQANRLYRLWLARNPDFEKRGRLHLIGHSLGSALLAHILSNQPTKMPPLSQLPRQVIMQTRNRFLFNTHTLFLCGSPLSIFLHLDQAQIMPRKGRERTLSGYLSVILAHDKTRPRTRRWTGSGSSAAWLSIRRSAFRVLVLISLYNVFYLSDPVAYRLNATVDSGLASSRPPLAINPVNTVPTSLSRYLPPPLRKQLEEKSARQGTIRLPSGLEMPGLNTEERLKGSKGERRFSALNPHGNIDFYLPSSGPSEYLGGSTYHSLGCLLLTPKI